MLRSNFMSTARLGVGIFAIMSLPAFAGSAEELSFPNIDIPITELGPEPLRIGRDYSTLELDRMVPGAPGHVVEGYDDTYQGTVTGWDYNVNFPIAGDSSELVCQYKVVIGEDGKVASTHWRRRSCEGLAQALIAAPEGEVRIMTLSSDVLFDFGEAELSQQGRERLREVAEQLRNEYVDPAITLVGHTDRIGSAEYNQQLSQRRAETVRRHLSQYGLPSASMVAEGRGMTEPVAFCRTDSREDLARCLQPNRRVEIEVFERGAGTTAL